MAYYVKDVAVWVGICAMIILAIILLIELFICG